MKPIHLSVTILVWVTGALLTSNAVRAAVTANDNACDPQYNGGAWNNNSNGGSGFGPWEMSPQVGAGNVGYFTGDAANNGNQCNSGGGIDTHCNGSGSSWGLWASKNNTANAIRTFAGTLQAGQSFTIAMDNGLVDNPGAAGFSLENCVNNPNNIAPDNYLFQFFLDGSASTYFINDSLTNRNTQISSTADGLLVVFTLTTPTTYSVTITSKSGGGPAKIITGTLATPSSGSQAITQVRLFNFQGQASTCNPGSSSGDCCHNLFFNSMSISAPASTASVKMGAAYDATLSNVAFRVYSSSASRIDLYLYNQPTNAPEFAHYSLSPDPSGVPGVWSISVSVRDLQQKGSTGTIYYGYRAWGPNWPFVSGWTTNGSSAGYLSDVDCAGNRFNPNKLLVDPYALEVSHTPLGPGRTDSTIYSSGQTSDAVDDGQQAPKGIVLQPDATSTGRQPARLLKDDIVYEVHVRGFTESDPTVPVNLRGTYAGVALKAPYLTNLGVTAVEFLPVPETDNDMDGVPNANPSLVNYWGYDPINFFAPDRRYASNKTPGGPTREFKAMVRQFHAAGIKVLLDVVYGHTWEGGITSGSLGDPNVQPLLSWRGLDNPTYYALLATNPIYSVDNTGCCGGNYNAYNPVAQQLILDSLTYWSGTMGVDGFRFDQGPILGNDTYGWFTWNPSDPNSAISRITATIQPRNQLTAVGTDLIAEPWANNAYEAGQFPPGWSEWNDQYRETVKDSQNELGNVAVTPSQLADKLAGSHWRFQFDGRFPWNSVNYLVSHDEMPLMDVYSCDACFDPIGASCSGCCKTSWDQGGNPGDQRRAARNGFAFPLLSAGTPMFTGGDEFLRTLGCIINPYNLDASTNWLNWSWVNNPAQVNFNTFAQRLVAFRKAHPALRPATWFTGTDATGDGMDDIDWFKSDGTQLTANNAWWSDSTQNAMAYRIDGTKFDDPSSAIYVAYNGWSGNVTFTLPNPGTNNFWWRVMDTSNDTPDAVARPGFETFIGPANSTYVLTNRCVALFIAKGGTSVPGTGQPHSP